MLHEYRKIAPIEAEKFDGNQGMINRYGVRWNDITFDIEAKQFLLPTEEGFMSLNTGDWIATGINGEHWVIADDIFHRTYERCE